MNHHRRTVDNNSSYNNSEENRTISYTVVCNDLSEIIKAEKLPLDVKRAIQHDITKQKQLPEKEKINVSSKMVDILNKVSPGRMKEAQEEDIDISNTIYYVKSGKNQHSSAYHQLILPNEFRVQVMEFLHNEHGHQAVEHTL